MVADISPQRVHEIGCELRAQMGADKFAGILPCSAEDALQFLAEWKIHSREDALALISLPRKGWDAFLEEMSIEQQYWTLAVAAQLAFEAAAVRHQTEVATRDVEVSPEIVKRMQATSHTTHFAPEAEWPFPTPRPEL